MPRGRGGEITASKQVTAPKDVIMDYILAHVNMDDLVLKNKDKISAIIEKQMMEAIKDFSWDSMISESMYDDESYLRRMLEARVQQALTLVCNHIFTPQIAATPERPRRRR